MTGKHQLDFQITKRENIADGYWLLRLRPTLGELPDIDPGQFVNILVENSRTTFLRRPISVNFADYSACELSLVIKEVGDGTRAICSLSEGDRLNIVLPLGNGFSYSDLGEGAEALLVGGGVGAAPLLYLSSHLSRKGVKVKILIGARSEKDLSQLEEFARYGEVAVTTEDGSAGTKGFVTDHEWMHALRPDRIFCCGPGPMMKAVAARASEAGIDCQVSLENRMACGVGACLCCVEDTKEGNLCVCSRGPVFNINELKWNDK